MTEENDKKTDRITVLAEDFTPAAMEFHRKNLFPHPNSPIRVPKNGVSKTGI